MIKAWLRLLRVVNLPTVPGDVLVGAAVYNIVSPRLLISACSASVIVYLFGLLDNDIVGAPTDRARPISEGLISLLSARIARGFCMVLLIAIGVFVRMPSAWWLCVCALLLFVVLYNRTKSPFLMGCCRAANVFSGSCAGGMIVRDLHSPATYIALLLVVVWFAYITGVTFYSEGEEYDPARRHRVGVLVGAIIYFQLGALIVLTLLSPMVNPLLIAGAVMLILLRIFTRLLPHVSAS